MNCVTFINSSIPLRVPSCHPCLRGSLPMFSPFHKLSNSLIHQFPSMFLRAIRVSVVPFLCSLLFTNSTIHQFINFLPQKTTFPHLKLRMRWRQINMLYTKITLHCQKIELLHKR
jgi:hypothetical protein